MYNTYKDIQAAGLMKSEEAPSFWNGNTIAFAVAVNGFFAFIYFGLPIVLG